MPCCPDSMPGHLAEEFTNFVLDRFFCESCGQVRTVSLRAGPMYASASPEEVNLYIVLRDLNPPVMWISIVGKPPSKVSFSLDASEDELDRIGKLLDLPVEVCDTSENAPAPQVH